MKQIYVVRVFWFVNILHLVVSVEKFLILILIEVNLKEYSDGKSRKEGFGCPDVHVFWSELLSSHLLQFYSCWMTTMLSSLITGCSKCLKFLYKYLVLENSVFSIWISLVDESNMPGKKLEFSCLLYFSKWRIFFLPEGEGSPVRLVVRSVWICKCFSAW